MFICTTDSNSAAWTNNDNLNKAMGKSWTSHIADSASLALSGCNVVGGWMSQAYTGASGAPGPDHLINSNYVTRF